MKKLDLNFFPSSLLSESRKVLGNEFTKLTSRIQTGYVKIFWNHYGLIGKNRHKKDKESFAMGGDEVQSNFTDARDFRAVNDTGYYLTPFRTKHGASDNRYSVTRDKRDGSTYCLPTEWVIKTVESSPKDKNYNGYKLSDKINNLMNDWYIRPDDKNNEHQGFVNSKGESINDLADANGGAVFRDKSNTSKTVNVNLNVVINKQSLQQHKQLLQPLLQYLNNNSIKKVIKDSDEWIAVKNILTSSTSNTAVRNLPAAPRSLGRGKVQCNTITPLQALMSKDIKTESIEHRINEIDRLLVSSREVGGSFTSVVYTEASTGRYTSKGGVLQGYRKSVRYAALSGCYEYDLEAAHQNILLQLLDRKGVDFPELDAMRDYVANKSAIRNQLAKELKTSITLVKRVINLLTYGGALCKTKHCKLPEVCDNDIELINRVVSNKWLKSFASAFRKSHKHLVGDNKHITNAVGIKTEVSKRGVDLAHILQGCERQVLDAVIKHSNRDDIALLIHDCVVFYNRQLPEELSKIVREETGFNLEFSEDKYTD